jgi:hypothetical protein
MIVVFIAVAVLSAFGLIYNSTADYAYAEQAMGQAFGALVCGVVLVIDLIAWLIYASLT